MKKIKQYFLKNGELIRSVTIGVLSDVIFLLLFFGANWNFLFCVLLSGGVFTSVSLLTKPCRKIGEVLIEDMANGEQLEQKLKEAKEDFRSIQRSMGKIEDSVLKEHTKQAIGSLNVAFDNQFQKLMNDELMDMEKLTKIILEDTTWEEVGLKELYGKVSVDTTNPAKSNSGNVFAGLLANVINNGITVNEDAANISKNGRRFKTKTNGNKIKFV